MIHSFLKNPARGSIWIRLLFSFAAIVNIPLAEIFFGENWPVFAIVLQLLCLALLYWFWIPTDGEAWPRASRVFLVVMVLAFIPGAVAYRDFFSAFMLVISASMLVLGGRSK